MLEKAVIEKFEGSYAVLLIGNQRRCVRFPRQLMPKGSKEGTQLLVEYDGKELVRISIAPNNQQN